MRPAWRRLRFWWSSCSSRSWRRCWWAACRANRRGPLDPASARPEGSRALAQILAGYGTAVTSRHDLSGGIADRTVVLTAPDDYSDGQLRELARRAARLVLVRPGIRATGAVAAGSQPTDFAAGTNAPGCADPGAMAAGRVNLPADTLVYRTAGIEGAVRCYGGAVVVAPRLVVLGSATLLTNAVLAHRGVAALDVNLVSADRSAPAVTWVLPGADAAGPGPATFWRCSPAAPTARSCG